MSEPAREHIHWRPRAMALAFALAGIAVGVLIGLPTLGARQDSDGGRFRAHLSVLDSPRTKNDVLPRFVFEDNDRSWFGDLSSARLAIARDGNRYFVVEGADDTVCVVEVRGARGDASATTNCVHESLLFDQRAVVVARQASEDSPIAIFGLAVDGARTAEAGEQQVAIRGNVFSLADAPHVETISINADNETATIRLPLPTADLPQ